ncbi:MAG: hypothetical protein E7016_04540 [Alphaproteobacteria bacterium]|nr:hypothetical protein [Alphaproteobacteria bacterium]
MENETKELAKTDTAIEIMAARVGICINRLIAEEDKPQNEQDAKLIERLNKELKILAKERERMYRGDKVVREKILNEYSTEVKEYFNKGETKELAKTDTAIEIMGAMRSTRITRLALEKNKPTELQDDKLITRLEKELDMLNAERHLMYKGDKVVREKILNEYSKEMTEYFKGKNSGR